MSGELGADSGPSPTKASSSPSAAIGVASTTSSASSSTSCESSSHCGIDISNPRGSFIFARARLTASIAVRATPMTSPCSEPIEPSGRADAVTMDECSCVGARIAPGRFSVGGLLGCSVIASMGVQSTRFESLKVESRVGPSFSRASSSSPSSASSTPIVGCVSAFARGTEALSTNPRVCPTLSRRARSSGGVFDATAHSDVGAAGIDGASLARSLDFFVLGSVSGDAESFSPIGDARFIGDSTTCVPPMKSASISSSACVPTTGSSSSSKSSNACVPPAKSSSPSVTRPSSSALAPASTSSSSSPPPPLPPAS